MCTARLLVGLLLAVIFSGAVSAADQPPQTENLSSSAANSESNTFPIAIRIEGSRLDDLLFDSHPEWTCYTMRAYFLKRDTPDSDTVHPVGYTTCQPAPRFQLKVTKRQVKPAPAEW